MATIHLPHESHQELNAHFSPNEQKSMLEDDTFAGLSVSGELFAVVMVGALAMLGTVLYIVNFYR